MEASERAPVVQFSAGSCLRGQRPHLPCERCAEACSVEAISLVGSGPRIDPATCLGCGACAAACPVGALAAPGFMPPPGTEKVLRIDCARVPRHLRACEDWAVPCHAGVTPALLVGQAPLDAPLRIEVVDRGWCAACPAARDANQAALLTARLQSAFAGIAGVAVVPREAPLDPARAGAPGSGPERNRRAVFRALLTRVPAVPRGGILAERAALAARAPHAALQPGVEIADSCADHGVCSAACPTGALARSEDEAGLLALRFSPARCIECGRCAEVCPEQALALRPRMSVSDRTVVLRETATAVCSRCERRFVPVHDQDTECPGCRKDSGLFQDLRRSLARGAVSPPVSARLASAPASSSGGTP